MAGSSMPGDLARRDSYSSKHVSFFESLGDVWKHTTPNNVLQAGRRREKYFVFLWFWQAFNLADERTCGAIRNGDFAQQLIDYSDK